jgi:hypothetical protein
VVWGVYAHRRSRGSAAVIAMLVVVTISVVRGAGGGAAEPSFDDASGGTELVLGPTGIGKLTLGMSEQQATATGEARMSPDWKSTGTVLIGHAASTLPVRK